MTGGASPNGTRPRVGPPGAGPPRSTDPSTGRQEAASPLARLALHPRQVAVAAVVVGLVCGPRAPWLVVALAAAAVAGTPAVRGGSARPLLAAAVAVLAGALIADARLAALDRTALRPREAATLRGHVVEPPRERSFGRRVAPLELTRGPARGERVLLQAPAHVRWPAVGVGDELVAHGRLRPLRGHEGFERRRNVHAVLETDRLTATGGARASAVDALRRRAERGLTAGLGGEQAALARGMVLGQDHALSEDLREAFRNAGLAHLVAASGANVMLLASLVLAVAAAAGAPLRARLALALAIVAVYVPLAGAGPSIQRAGVMGAAGLVAALAGRPGSRWYALLLAAAATLTLNPRAVEDPGWQLSFAAVLAILALHGRLGARLRAGGVPGGAADATALTVTATLGTAPLLALHFGEVSLVSLPANLLAVPAVAPVMWLGTLAAALGGPAAPALNALAGLPLGYLAWLGRAAASLPHASTPIEVPGPLATAATYAAIALAVHRRRAITVALRRAARVTGAAAVARWIGLAPPPGARGLARWGPAAAACCAAGAAALALLPGPPRPPPGFALSALDVGQGDAILLQHADRTVLVDTGPPGAPVVERLREAGVRRLDVLLVTHASADHEGNAVEVMQRMPVGLLLDGTGHLRAPPGIPRHDPRAGEVLAVGPMRLEILWPPPGVERSRDDPNVTATVALARDGATTALLTADAESPVTLPLDLPRADILKVAHHGSVDEGLRSLVERVRPRVAVVPVGPNTYGHPAPSTMRALGVVPRVVRTDRDGTVRITPAAGGLAVDTGH